MRCVRIIVIKVALFLCPIQVTISLLPTRDLSGFCIKTVACRIILNCMRGSRNFRQGGSRSPWQKSSDNVFFPVLSFCFRSQMVNFKENYHFSRFQRRSTIFSGRVQLVPGGGSNCLFPIETHITCDFPGGSGPLPPTPPPPLWIRTWIVTKCLDSQVWTRLLNVNITYTRRNNNRMTASVELWDVMFFSTILSVTYIALESRNLYVVCGGTGQLVPKSTRTLVNSYPFLVNSYLSQLVPKSTRTLVYL